MTLGQGEVQPTIHVLEEDDCRFRERAAESFGGAANKRVPQSPNRMRKRAWDSAKEKELNTQIRI